MLSVTAARATDRHEDTVLALLTRANDGSGVHHLDLLVDLNETRRGARATDLLRLGDSGGAQAGESWLQVGMLANGLPSAGREVLGAPEREALQREVAHSGGLGHNVAATVQAHGYDVLWRGDGATHCWLHCLSAVLRQFHRATEQQLAELQEAGAPLPRAGAGVVAILYRSVGCAMCLHYMQDGSMFEQVDD